MIVVILVLAVIWVCWSCALRKLNLTNETDVLFVRVFAFTCCPVCTVVVILVMASVVWVFIFPPNYQLSRQNSDSSTTMCQFVEVPAATVAVSYLLFALLCLSMTISCCYICKQKRNHNVPAHCFPWDTYKYLMHIMCTSSYYQKKGRLRCKLACASHLHCAIILSVNCTIVTWF